ncbi:hypothetical protein [Streptomyces sp. NPDC053427]
MTAVMVELTPPQTAEDPDEVAVIEDIDAFTAQAGTVPGCNDDNPYR